MSTGEFIPLSERTSTSRGNTTRGGTNAETTFNTKGCGAASSSSGSDHTYDPKHEKKVTFARLLNRVSVSVYKTYLIYSRKKMLCYV